ncbi:MAG: NAD(P)/FAD-dependent oxidoreductase, partial [Paracoccaceae bacterium]
MAQITVYGAGIFGLSVAWAAQERGADVQVVDPHGVGAGSSGGIVGALAPHVPENWNPKKAFQLDSLLMAEPWWERIAQVGGTDPGYARSGRIQPLADAQAVALAQTRAKGAETLWQGRAQWEVTSQGGPRAGMLGPDSPTGLWVHDTLTARLHPKRACAALAAALTARGGQITAEPPTGPQGQVVWATGWQGLTTLNDALGGQCGGRVVGAGIKGQAVLLDLTAHPDWQADQWLHAPQVFVDGMHIVPHADGTIAIGSTSERVFDAPDTTDAQCDDLLARARAALPVLRDAPERLRWAGVRPRTRSRAPMLGPWPNRPGHFIANGGFKIGFGMAP